MKTLILSILLLTFHAGDAQNADSLNIAPNPFNASTCIYYGLAGNDTVSLYLYNMFGQTVKTFMQDSLMNSGFYSTCFQADSLADGIYLVSLNLGIHKKIIKKAIKYNVSSVVENGSFIDPGLYPNPTANLLTISMEGIKNIIITDPGGKTCKIFKTHGKVISLADLKPGSYIINIFSADHKLLSTGKIVKL